MNRLIFYFIFLKKKEYKLLGTIAVILDFHLQVFDATKNAFLNHQKSILQPLIKFLKNKQKKKKKKINYLTKFLKFFDIDSVGTRHVA